MINNLTYREKTLWLNLLTTLALLGYYFLSIATGNLSGEAAIWLYLKVVFWIVVLEIIVLSVLASIKKPEKPDERDRTIQARAYKYGYFVLIAGLAITLWQISVNALANRVEELPEGGQKVAEIVSAFNATATPYITINIILLTLAIAELAKSATQLIYYRKGI